jgi:hypothetical protein
LLLKTRLQHRTAQQEGIPWISLFTTHAQVIDIWDASDYERSTEALEAAIKAAIQDALSETRNAGRAALVAYSRARPDRVAAVLGSVDASLAQKLKEGLQDGELHT